MNPDFVITECRCTLNACVTMIKRQSTQHTQWRIHMASDASIPVWTPQILSSNLKKKKRNANK